MGLKTLTTGRKTASTQRRRPMASPMITPTAAPRPNPITSRASELLTCLTITPLPTSRAKVAAIFSTPGNSRGGNGPQTANACQARAATAKGSSSSKNPRSERRRGRPALLASQGLGQQPLVDALAHVGGALDGAGGQQLLDLVGQVAVHLGGDLGLPAHAAQRLVEHGHRHLAPHLLLLLGVDGGRPLRLFLEELDPAQPAAQV